MSEPNTTIECGRCGTGIEPVDMERAVVDLRVNAPHDVGRAVPLCIDCERSLAEWFGEPGDAFHRAETIAAKLAGAPEPRRARIGTADVLDCLTFGRVALRDAARDRRAVALETQGRLALPLEDGDRRRRGRNH